jgi:diacylglycerol kinase (ATP)
MHSVDHRATLLLTTPRTSLRLHGSGAQQFESLRRRFPRLRALTATDVFTVHRELEARPAELLIAAGGDGTVNLAIRSLLRGMRLGILPLGTANDMARGLGIPLRPLTVPTYAETRAVDLLVSNGQRFCTVGGLGLPSSVVARVDVLRQSSALGRVFDKLGDALYPLVAAEIALRDAPRYPVDLHWDCAETGCARRLHLECAGLLVANQPRLAGRLTIAPGADRNDGVFELIVIHASGRLGILHQLVRFHGTAAREPATFPIRAYRARVRCGTELPFFGDGEVLTHATQFDIRLERSALELAI